MCQVGCVVTLALVHGVVVGQAHLVACEQLVAVVVEQVDVHGTVPHPTLQHASFVEAALRHVCLVGRTEDDGSIAAVGDIAEDGIQSDGEEGECLGSIVERHCHTLEAWSLDGGFGLIGLAVDNSFQTLVFGKPQLQLLAVAAMREDGHVDARVVGLNHHLHGHVLIGEVAACLALGIALAEELEGRCFLYAALVGFALHLKVGGGLQVVVFDVFGEVEDDVVASTQHTVFRFGVAEELWTAGVFHTCEHFRGIGQEGVAIATEEHGSKVIGFLHLHSLAKEARDDVAVLRYHRLRATGSSVEGGVGIVATEVCPIVVATRGFLVLELNVVEIVLILVETSDDNRQVPSLTVFIRRIGVHNPLVARHGDGHCSCGLQIVDIERRLVEDIHIA